MTNPSRARQLWKTASPWLHLGVAVLAGFLIARFAISSAAHPGPLLSRYIAWREHRSPITSAVLSALFFLYTIAKIGAGISLAVWYVRRKPEKRRLVLGLIAALVIASVGQTLLFWFSSDRVALTNHSPLLSRIELRVDLTGVLILLGIALYVFKKKAKALFGLMQVIVAVASNIALIDKFDYSPAGQITAPGLSAIGLLVFAFLLSAGIANVAEGIDELRSTHAAELDATSRRLKYWFEH
jgi:hypothetical protein